MCKLMVFPAKRAGTNVRVHNQCGDLCRNDEGRSTAIEITDQRASVRFLLSLKTANLSLGSFIEEAVTCAASRKGRWPGAVLQCPLAGAEGGSLGSASLFLWTLTETLQGTTFSVYGRKARGSVSTQ